jgi:hypothetical protein
VVVLLMGLDSFAVGIKARVWIAGPPEQPRKPVTRLELLERQPEPEPRNTHREGQFEQQLDRIDGLMSTKKTRDSGRGAGQGSSEQATSIQE